MNDAKPGSKEYRDAEKKLRKNEAKQQELRLYAKVELNPEINVLNAKEEKHQQQQDAYLNDFLGGFVANMDVQNRVKDIVTMDANVKAKVKKALQDDLERILHAPKTNDGAADGEADQDEPQPGAADDNDVAVVNDPNKINSADEGQ